MKNIISKKKLPKQLPLETLMDNLIGKYIPPNSKFFGDDYCFKSAPLFYNKQVELMLKGLMKDNIVWTGYGASAIKGCHNYYIFWRNKKEFK